MDFDIYKLYYSPIENKKSKIYYGNETRNIVIGTPTIYIEDYRANNNNQKYIICRFDESYNCTKFVEFVEMIEQKIFSDINNHDESLSITMYKPFYNNHMIKIFIDDIKTKYFQNDTQIDNIDQLILKDKMLYASLVLDTLNVDKDSCYLKWDALEINFC